MSGVFRRGWFLLRSEAIFLPMPQTIHPDKIAVFVHEYLRDYNASRAILATGFDGKAPGQAGSEFLNNPEVREYMQQIVAGRDKVRTFDTNRWLHTLETIAFYDAASILDQDGRVKPPSEWTDADRLAVQDITVETRFEKDADGVQRAVGTVTRIKRMPRDKALDMLARHKSLYNDVVRVEGLDGLGDRLARLHQMEEAERLPAVNGTVEPKAVTYHPGPDPDVAEVIDPPGDRAHE